MKQSKGLALIIVLWVITLLTIMASSFALTIQRETTVISGIKEKVEASALAEAGINYAIIMLLSKDPENKWQSFDNLYEINYQNKRIRIQIADESGKISINHTNKLELEGLLDSINLDESQVASLSDAILDWRDENDLHRLNGAEKKQYEEANLKYEPRNSLFESLEELQMVLGMTPKIYQQLENLISIYTNKPTINPKTASRSVLLTLADVDEEMVDQYLHQRDESVRNSEPVENPAWFQGNASQTNVYMILAEAMIDKNITKQIKAVIRKKGGQVGLPYEVLQWNKDYLQASLFLPENDARVIN